MGPALIPDPRKTVAIEVAGKCQTLFERGVGGPKGYRMLIHDDRYQYSNRRGTGLFIVLSDISHLTLAQCHCRAVRVRLYQCANVERGEGGSQGS